MENIKFHDYKAEEESIRAKELRIYLEYRFKLNNHSKYQKYRDEWIENLTPEQLSYFAEEKKRIYARGYANKYNTH